MLNNNQSINHVYVWVIAEVIKKHEEFISEYILLYVYYLTLSMYSIKIYDFNQTTHSIQNPVPHI